MLVAESLLTAHAGLRLCLLVKAFPVPTPGNRLPECLKSFQVKKFSLKCSAFVGGPTLEPIVNIAALSLFAIVKMGGEGHTSPRENCQAISESRGKHRFECLPHDMRVWFMS